MLIAQEFSPGSEMKNVFQLFQNSPHHQFAHLVMSLDVMIEWSSVDLYIIYITPSQLFLLLIVY